MDENKINDELDVSIKESENDGNENSATETESTDISVKVSTAKKWSPFFCEKSIFAFILIFCFVLICSTFTFQVWLSPIKVIGTSMQPTINQSVLSESDENHCDVVYYAKEKTYNNGDIVIVANPNNKYVNDSKVSHVIKRVIATPGQKIRFFQTRFEDLGPNKDDKRFYYSFTVLDEKGIDVEIDESFLTEEMFFTATQIEVYSSVDTSFYFPFFKEIFDKVAYGEVFEYTIPNETYFIMGDNRNNSEDSRFFGVVDYEDISGSVKLIVAYGKNIFSAIYIKLKYGY